MPDADVRQHTIVELLEFANGLPLDFEEREQRAGIIFLGHSKLPRGRARRTRECLTADEMSGLKPVLNVFGDFLEIFSKRYGATVPIAAGYLTRRRLAQL
jgi:hypothetical protein